jgi:hypothetical protein
MVGAVVGARRPGALRDVVGRLEAAAEVVGSLLRVGGVVAEAHDGRGAVQQVPGVGWALGLAERGCGEQSEQEGEQHEPGDPSHGFPFRRLRG